MSETFEYTPEYAPVAGFQWKCVLVLLFAFCVALIGADTPAFFDIDAPKYAQATYEMAETGDLVRPMFNGEPRAKKPPLTYWLMLPAFKAALAVGGKAWITPLTGRVAAAFFYMLLTGAVIAVGARLFSPLTGLMAGLLVSCSVLFKFMGLMVKVDIFFTSILAWNAYFLLLRFQGAARKTVFWGLTATCSLAVLAKGPFGLMLMAGYGVAVFWDRVVFCEDRKSLSGELRFIGSEAVFVIGTSLLACLPLGIWFLLTVLAGSDSFISVFLDQVQLNTTLTPLDTANNSRAFRLTSYFDTLVTYSYPFGAYVPAALYTLVRDAMQDREKRRTALFLFGMSLFFLLLVMFVFKHVANRYLLPVAPFFALMVADWLLNARRDKTYRLLFDISSLWLVVSSIVLAWKNIKGGFVPTAFYFDFPVTDYWGLCLPLAVAVGVFFALFIWVSLGQGKHPVRHVVVTSVAFALVLPFYFSVLPGPDKDAHHAKGLLTHALVQEVKKTGPAPLVVHSYLFSQMNPDFIFMMHAGFPYSGSGSGPDYSLAPDYNSKVLLDVLMHPERAEDTARIRRPDREDLPAVRYFETRKFDNAVLFLTSSEYGRFSGYVRSLPESERPALEITTVQGLNVKFMGMTVYVVRPAKHVASSSIPSKTHREAAS